MLTLDQIAGRFAYTPDHEAFRQTVRSFLQKEGVPHVNDWEKNRIVPKDFWRKAGEIGMLCPTVPEAYGGLGLDFGYNAIVDEEMSYNGVPAGFSLQSDIVCDYIAHYGSEEQKRDWLPRLVSGETITAIAMTEPGTGSRPGRPSATRAAREGRQGVRPQRGEDVHHQRAATPTSGDRRRQDRSRSQVRRTEGISIVLVVDAASRGLPSAGSKIHKLGQHASDTSELFFDDVRVPIGPICLGERGDRLRAS